MIGESLSKKLNLKRQQDTTIRDSNTSQNQQQKVIRNVLKFHGKLMWSLFIQSKANVSSS